MAGAQESGEAAADKQSDEAEKNGYGWIVLGAGATVVLALVGLAILRRR